MKNREHDEVQILDEIREEIKTKIEKEKFAQSVYYHEEEDNIMVERCRDIIAAYKNVIKIIDKYETKGGE